MSESKPVTLQPSGAVMRSLCGDRIGGGKRTHCPAMSPGTTHFTALSLSCSICKMGIKTCLTGPRETVGAQLKPVTLLPAFPEREEAGERQDSPVSVPSCFSGGGSSPHRVAGAPAGPTEADPPSPLPFHWAPRRELVVPRAPAAGRPGLGLGSR